MTIAAHDPSEDGALGALLGLAVGDALGTTLEFSARDTRPPLTDMIGGGPFGLKPGEWTDDTSMALALAESLLEHPGLDARDLMTRFVAWWREGRYSVTGHCFDIGTTTAQALARFRRTGEPFAGDTSESSAGNGSIMRLAPVALAAAPDRERAMHLAREQARTTHGAPQSVDGAALMAGILVDLIGGAGRDALVDPRFSGHAAVEAIARGTWRGRDRAAIRSSGYVVHTLEAALWAVERTDSFEAAVLLAANLGDDADTVGAVAGQIAGALHGLSAIPARWLERLAWRDEIETLGRRLIAAAPAGG